jgi:hypothetical protein
MLDDRDVPLDAGENGCGQQAVWRCVYAMMKYDLTACHLGSYCWLDPVAQWSPSSNASPACVTHNLFDNPKFPDVPQFSGNESASTTGKINSMISSTTIWFSIGMKIYALHWLNGRSFPETWVILIVFF